MGKGSWNNDSKPLDLRLEAKITKDDLGSKDALVLPSTDRGEIWGFSMLDSPGIANKNREQVGVFNFWGDEININQP